MSEACDLRLHVTPMTTPSHVTDRQKSEISHHCLFGSKSRRFSPSGEASLSPSRRHPQNWDSKPLMGPRISIGSRMSDICPPVKPSAISILALLPAPAIARWSPTGLQAMLAARGNNRRGSCPSHLHLHLLHGAKPPRPRSLSNVTGSPHGRPATLEFGENP